VSALPTAGTASAVGRAPRLARLARWRSAARGAGSPALWLLPLIALQALLAALWPLPWPLAGAGAPALPVAPALSPVLALAAFALIAGGGWTIRSAARELDWNATPVCAADVPRALVTTGPYRLSRHPMDLGAVSVLAGAAIAIGSPVALAVTLAVTLACAAWIDRVSMRAEDAVLHERFGPAWRAYAATVRRWI
jgi:protein-S-isoprenylcysteine O-methyltransferase Ste14